MIAQSFAGWPSRAAGPVTTEDDPFDPDLPAAMRPALEAIKHLEHAVVASPLEGIVLRYGGLYGPAAVRSVINREKLRHLGPPADIPALVAQTSRPGRVAGAAEPR